MSEWKWWAAITENNEIVLINPYRRREPETKSAPSNKWVEVEIRLLNQPPCEWELKTGDFPISLYPAGFPTNLSLLVRQGHKYCPECGRKI